MYAVGVKTEASGRVYFGPKHCPGIALTFFKLLFFPPQLTVKQSGGITQAAAGKIAGRQRLGNSGRRLSQMEHMGANRTVARE